jgi:hypothetical protein
MAARLRRELGIDVDMVHGRYGEFKVLVDDQAINEGGALGMMGVLPSARKIVEEVHEHLAIKA